MLSKLTFSLALVLMLAFLATSAMAQDTDDVGVIAVGQSSIVGQVGAPAGVVVAAVADGSSIVEGIVCLIWRIFYALVARSNCKCS